MRPQNFRFDIPGYKEVKTVIQEKLQKVKASISKTRDSPVNNADIMQELLDCWIQHNITQNVRIT